MLLPFLLRSIRFRGAFTGGWVRAGGQCEPGPRLNAQDVGGGIKRALVLAALRFAESLMRINLCSGVILYCRQFGWLGNDSLNTSSPIPNGYTFRALVRLCRAEISGGRRGRQCRARGREARLVPGVACVAVAGRNGSLACAGGRREGGMAEMGGVVGAWTHAAGLLAVRPVPCVTGTCAAAPRFTDLRRPPATRRPWPWRPGPGLGALHDGNLTSLALLDSSDLPCILKPIPGKKRHIHTARAHCSNAHDELALTLLINHKPRPCLVRGKICLFNVRNSCSIL